MKRTITVILLTVVTSFAQVQEKAVPTYSENDKLIGLTNLTSDLSNCSIRSVTGKIRKIKKSTESAQLSLRIDKKNSAAVLVPLERIAREDRGSMFSHLVTKNNIIRVSGYTCDPEAPFSAFSVDRVY
jgi:hypothetical protein